MGFSWENLEYVYDSEIEFYIDNIDSRDVKWRVCVTRRAGNVNGSWLCAKIEV